MAPLVLVRVTGAALAGALAVLVARAYGAEGSGEFFLTVTTLTVISVVTRLGAESYITSRLASWQERDSRGPAQDLASTMLAMVAVVSLFFAVVMVGRLIWPGPVETAFAGLPLWAAALGVLGLNMSWISTGYHRARGRAGLSIFLETGLLSLWLLGLVVATRAVHATPRALDVALSLALMAPTLLVPLLPTLLHARGHLLSWDGTRAALVGLVSFGAVTVTNGIIVLIPLQVLGWYGLTHEAGVYNAGQRVSMFVGAFGVVVKSIIVRGAARGSPSRGDSRGQDVMLAAAMCVPWLVLAAIISWQGQLLVTLFGKEFQDLRSIIFLMLVAQSVNIAGFPIETKAVLADERKLLNVTSVITLVTALLASLVLVDRHGLTGAVWAFAITITATRTLLAVLYVLRTFSPDVPAAPAPAPDPQELR